LSRVSRNAATVDSVLSSHIRSGAGTGAGAATGPGQGPGQSPGPGTSTGSTSSPASGEAFPAPARKLSGRRRPEIVAVLLFSGAPIFESSIPLSVFGVDRQDAGVPRYRLLVCAGEEGPLATTGGLTLTAPHGLEALSRAGTVVVPAWRSAAQLPPPEALAALRKAHAEGARIIGLCTGAFVLAAAGLLDGRPATTHWMYAPTLAKRYPQVQVDPRELFIDDGDVLTSAGTAAGIDLCLHVVRNDHGSEAAAALARRLVVPARRSGGQAQYIDRSLPEEIGNDPLAEVVTWALDNLSKQFDVEALAARAYMSRRTFDRRFRSLTGSAPLQWLISQRVLQAQRLLETTEASVDEVARRCGFRSPVALRGHFRRQLGVSPAVYRTSFRTRRVQAPGTGVSGTVPPQGGPVEDEFGLLQLGAGAQGKQGQQGVGPNGPGGEGEQTRLSRSVGRTRPNERPDSADHAAAEDGRAENGARGRRDPGASSTRGAGAPPGPPGPLPARGHPDPAWAAVQRRVSE
jgi:transcriptional regulator GlxA family with amidase domain